MARATTDNEEGVSGHNLAVRDAERIKRKNIMDKRSGADLKKKWEQRDRADIEEAERAAAPEPIRELKCHVCTSKHRLFVEQALVKGHSYRAIERQIPEDEDGHKIDRRSIANHFREHMDLERQRIRAELEEQAALLGQNMELGASGALTDRGMLKVIAQKAYDDIIKGVSTVEPKDLLQAIKLLNDMEVKASTDRAEENEIRMRIFVQAIQEICDEDTIRLIVGAAERIRNQDDIEVVMAGNLMEPPKELVIEAEVVDGD